MLKRVLAALLWFYAGWYAGNLLADFTGVSMYLGPILGAAAAALMAGDPRQIIWNARAMSKHAARVNEVATDPA